MMSKARISLEGNVGRDAEVRVKPGGSQNDTISLSLCVNVRKKKGDAIVTTESWFECVKWSKDGINDTFAKIKSGEFISIDGKLEVEKYTDKEGIPRQTLKVTVTDFTPLSRMLGKKSDHIDASEKDGTQSQPVMSNESEEFDF